MSFWQWYFYRAPREIPFLLNGFLRFVVRFFAFGKHLRTLFSPWHRDVRWRNYRGLHPLLWARLLLDNLFARLMGAIARLTVMSAGAVVLALAVTAALAAGLMWFFWPLLTIGALLWSFSSQSVWPALVGLAFFLLWAAVVYRSRTLSREEKNYRQMTLVELLREPRFERILRRLGLSKKDISPEMTRDFELFAQMLAARGIEMAEFDRLLSREIKIWEREILRKKWWREENWRTVPPLGRYWSYGWTVLLDRYGTDLTASEDTRTLETEPIGREEVMNLLLLTLQRPHDNNALLVGGVGVGKKTLVRHLAAAIHRGDFDNSLLRDKRVVLLDTGAALADAAHSPDGVDLFLHRLFHEAAHAGNVILVLDNFHRYTRNDKTTYDITPILAEYAPLGSFQVIAITSRKAFRRDLRHRGDILKNFSVIDVPELSAEETLEVLLNKFAEVERERPVFTLAALKEIITLSGRYRADAPLPERAIDLAMEVFLHKRDSLVADEEAMIEREAVRDFVTLKTGMPLGAIDEKEKDKLLHLEDLLHRRIVGQEAAVRQVAEAVRIMRSGIGDSSKPMSSFLFLGPTGVGKTETAKALADIYYGSEKAMIRMDMSEFQGPGALGRLIGDEALDEPGRLTAAVRENPYSLLLLDELEKADSRVLDIFLQILDEGFVTDAFGSKISFRNVIIIATSNAEAVFLADELKKGTAIDRLKQAMIDRMVRKGIYRMEFLNRFSDIILFRPLSRRELAAVVSLMLERLARRLKKEKNITLRVREEVIEKIITEGYDEVFGARSLARYIDDKIADVLARKIIAGGVGFGETLEIGAADLDRD